MKKSPGYYILLAITWPMQLFPLAFHYLIADLLYILVYRVAGYRKAVVAENLRNSFPEKSPEERKLIEKQFYHGFTDMFIETLYFTHINIEKQKHRLEVVNFKPVQDLLDKGRNVITVAGHFGNRCQIDTLRKQVADEGAAHVVGGGFLQQTGFQGAFLE